MKVAIVGAGIMGSCTGRELARRGHRVVIYDQFEPGHRLGSSHGQSRIVRKAYPDVFHTRLMAEGYPLWRSIQLEANECILYEVGLAYFGAVDSAAIHEMARGLKEVGEPFDVLDATQVRRVFPNLRLEPHEVAVYTPQAGWVHAARAIRWILVQAERAGADIERKRITEPELLATEHDAMVVCPGAWITDFTKIPVQVTLQTFAYIRSNQTGPVWIEDGPLGMYGFPSEPGQGSFKVGYHAPGAEIDPRLPGRPPSTEALSEVARVCAQRFGMLDPEMEDAQGCLYTRTADEKFRFGRLGENGFWASPCSGHGFKFGPWVGRFLADVVEGKRAIDTYPEFCASADEGAS